MFIEVQVSSQSYDNPHYHYRREWCRFVMNTQCFWCSLLRLGLRRGGSNVIGRNKTCLSNMMSHGLLFILDLWIGLILMGIGRKTCLPKTKLGSSSVEIANLLGIKGSSIGLLSSWTTSIVSYAAAKGGGGGDRVGVKWLSYVCVGDWQSSCIFNKVSLRGVEIMPALSLQMKITVWNITLKPVSVWNGKNRSFANLANIRA
jgi:hypothetical protein